MNTTETDSFYVTGGTLRRDAACYVQRRADQALYDGAMQGNFCYVLTSRQMGKSSLMVRTAARLREDGVHVAVLDLTAIGQNLNAEQWYDGLLARVGQQFQLEDELEEFWLNHSRLSPLLRWMKAIREVVLPRLAGRIVLFVDEIDAVRSLPFSTDEFFAAIRELYNRRTEEAELERLTFCLLGVASPSDLIRDTRTTPFNIGQRIELNDFTDDEAAPLKRGLGREDKTAAKLLKRILYWTGGHPYLTQRLCQATAEDANVNDAAGIDRLCEELFFTTRARERDDNLLFVRERMLKSEADRAALLDLYKKLRDNQRVKDDETNPLISVLRLSGITRVAEGLLYVRNRIYYRVFDREWVLANLPDAEVQRQKAAYRRGVIRTATIAAVMLAVVSGLALLALRQRNQAKQQAMTNRRLLYAAQMNMVQQDWESANMLRFDKLLAQQIPQPGEEDLRGFEWYYFWQARQARGEIATFKLPDRGAEVVAFSPDGKLLAWGEISGIVVLQDVATRKEMRRFKIPVGRARALVFSPDGKTLAMKCENLRERGSIELWDIVTGQSRTVFSRNAWPGARSNSAPVFTPDGLLIAVVTNDRKIQLVDVLRGQEVTYIKTDSDKVRSVVLSPDGKTIIAIVDDKLVKLWNVNTKRERAAFEGSDLSFVLSPDGKMLAIKDGQDATNGQAGTVSVWEIASRRQVFTFKDERVDIARISFSPDSKLLASGGEASTIKLWDVSAGQEMATYQGHASFLHAIAFSSDGKKLASSSMDATVKLWEVAAQPAPFPLTDPTNKSKQVAFSPDGKMLASGTYDWASNDKINAQVKLWDVATGQEMAALSGHEKNIWCIAFSPDGKTVASGSSDLTAKLWDISTKREIATLKHQGYVASVAFSPDGKTVATGSADGTMKLWEVATGRELANLPQEGFVQMVGFSPNGKLLVSGGGVTIEGKSRHFLKIWDVATGRELADLKSHTSSPTSIAFSPDGKTLASGNQDFTVKLWDVATGQARAILEGHRSLVEALAFSPDGKTLASGSWDNTIRLWNVATGIEMTVFNDRGSNANSRVSSLAFSPDGKLLVSALDHIKLWRAATDADVQARRGQ